MAVVVNKCKIGAEDSLDNIFPKLAGCISLKGLFEILQAKLAMSAQDCVMYLQSLLDRQCLCCATLSGGINKIWDIAMECFALGTFLGEAVMLDALRQALAREPQ
ncbi:uncharacterized protein SRS1_21024 [Sporisorium reilianum f. sp. reilianum]|uniref:Uncharacterized protein n=1 Tax=Sporisorium reilianum f. sp. reilianum TaxID=72559 RepID=A0A2N8UKC5_9BASI|nr:uncharacterized protein SRS1_21024 [Sporisorium reilianum f. sp. reilianum]